MTRTKELAQRFQTLSVAISLAEVVEWERDEVIGSFVTASYFYIITDMSQNLLPPPTSGSIAPINITL